MRAVTAMCKEKASKWLLFSRSCKLLLAALASSRIRASFSGGLYFPILLASLRRLFNQFGELAIDGRHQPEGAFYATLRNSVYGPP